MIKITEKNRGLFFLGVIMIIGVLAMGVIMLAEEVGDSTKDPDLVESVGGYFGDFKKKIADLKTQNFNPTSYNTLATDIDSHYQQDLITKDAQLALKSDLTSVYTGLVYSRCEFYLTGNNLNSSSDILLWLKQLENITSRSAKTDYYRGQINAYVYYSQTLPNKVSAFISPGITNYNQDVYDSLTDEAKNMPKLNTSYKNRSNFIGVRNSLISQLEQFRTDWATGGVQIP